MTPHSYLISITPLSDGAGYGSVMSAVIGLPLSSGSGMRTAGSTPSLTRVSASHELRHTVLCVCPRKTSGMCFIFFFYSFKSINQSSFPHLMYLFLMNTQVGFKIHQEQNKHYLSSHCVNQPSIIAITIATVCCQDLLPLNSFPSINSKSNPSAATNVCFFFFFLYPTTHLFVKMDSVTVQ